MRRTTLALLVACVLPVTVAGGQSRVVQRHSLGEAEGRLMGYYSAALAFSGIGPAAAGRPWAFEAGLEASWIPFLSAEQRTAGFDKPEASNLAPVLPRPRFALSLPGAVRAEVGYVPPLTVFDARAHLASLAFSRAFTLGERVHVVPRVSGLAGRVQGAITCYEAMASGTVDEQVYYGNVCHGRRSRDYFDPKHLSIDVALSGPLVFRGGTPYVGVGVRREHTRFDIGVIRDDGSRDTDHPVLEMTATRPFAVAGTAWKRGPRLGGGAELFYSPGSLLTVRMLALVRVR